MKIKILCKGDYSCFDGPKFPITVEAEIRNDMYYVKGEDLNKYCNKNESMPFNDKDVYPFIEKEVEVINKIKILCDGEYAGLDETKFPITVEAEIMAGMYYVKGEDLNKYCYKNGSKTFIDGNVYPFIEKEVEVING